MAVQRLCGDRGTRAAAHGPASRPTCTVHPIPQEFIVPKGEQRSNKLIKKPKKDSTPLKEASAVSTRPTPPTTTVMPKGKMKNKEV
jgi:hypothetical protein